MKHSLPLRINLISLVFAAVVASVLVGFGGVFLYQQQAESAMTRALLATDDLSDRAERLLALDMHFEDFLGFDDQCAAVIRGDELLAGAAIFSIAGKEQFASKSQRITWPAGAALPAPGTTREVDTRTGRIAMRAVQGPHDEVVGYAAVTIDDAAVLRMTLRTVGWLALSALCLFVVGLVIQQGIFWRAVGRPLASLVKEADELRVDDLGKMEALRARVDESDIGKVYGSLTRLMQRVQDARAALLVHAERLEAAVRERTVQLEQANTELAHDIERRKQLEQELRTLASTDALTGLANRAFVMPYLERRLEQARRNYTPLGVLVLDFDDFKEINDSYGHLVGDQVLQVMSKRLQQICRQSDVLARLGGDEFLIVLEDALDDIQADGLCRRILGAFDMPVQVGGMELSLGISIGFAIFPRNGGDMLSLMSAADRAMYQAKNSGGGYKFAPSQNPGLLDELTQQQLL